MKLHQVYNGIKSFSNKLIVRKPTMVVVHGFNTMLGDISELEKSVEELREIHLENPDDPLVKKDYLREQNLLKYQRGLVRAILTHKGNIVDIETKYMIPRNSEIYEQIGRTDNIYFIESSPLNAKPEPDVMSERVFFSILARMSPLILAGEFFWNDDDDPGCLGRLIQDINYSGIDHKVRTELTYG